MQDLIIDNSIYMVSITCNFSLNSYTTRIATRQQWQKIFKATCFHDSPKHGGEYGGEFAAGSVQGSN